MGYTTSFDGAFSVTPTLKPEHQAYLRAFATSRRIKRDADIATTLPDPVRIAAGLPIGFEGAYYIGGADKNYGQDRDESILDYNEPPGVPQIPPIDPINPMQDFRTRYVKELELKQAALTIGVAQPGLWCQWIPNEDGSAIAWDYGEKFYEYIEWIRYLIAHFLAPWGYKLNGEVYWDGEERGDQGVIRIIDNVVSVGSAVVTYSFT